MYMYYRRQTRSLSFIKLNFFFGFVRIFISFLINNVLRKTIIQSSNKTVIQNLSNCRHICIFVSIYAANKSFIFGYSFHSICVYFVINDATKYAYFYNIHHTIYNSRSVLNILYCISD